MIAHEILQYLLEPYRKGASGEERQKHVYRLQGPLAREFSRVAHFEQPVEDDSTNVYEEVVAAQESLADN